MSASGFIRVLFTVLLFAACASDDTAYTLSNRINARTFTVHTPGGWVLLEDPGIDTYIGRIAGPEDTIAFDQGYFSFGSLDNISETDQTLFFQKLSINGTPAIIHQERTQGDLNGEIRWSVYLDAGDNQHLNHLYVFDPEDEALVLHIFITHQFK